MFFRASVHSSSVWTRGYEMCYVSRETMLPAVVEAVTNYDGKVWIRVGMVTVWWSSENKTPGKRRSPMEKSSTEFWMVFSQKVS